MKVKIYVLSGNPKQVEAVVKENRIRASRGVIKFTPYECEESDLAQLNGSCGVADDDMDDMPSVVNELNEKLMEKDKEIAELRRQLDEATASAHNEPTEEDQKEPAEEDTKGEPSADSKEEPAPDTKDPAEADTKTPKRTKKTE